MKPADFAVAVYLNQSVVFDLLAILEDGMAQVSTIRSSESSKAQAGAGIGASNVFALLGVRMKGEIGSSEDREVTQERVHTPLSLFAKVRRQLQDAKLVHDLTGSPLDLDKVKPGHFVEVEVRLKKNPVVQSLEALVETIGGIRILTSFNQGEKKTQEQKNQETNLSRIAEQSKNLIGGLTGKGASDLLGEVVPGPGHAVVSVEDRYFSEHSSDEIADGQFRVFGKVARVVRADDDGISLLRNTKFASMPTALDPLRVGIAQMRGTGPKIPEFETEVKPPALQIRAIAIYL